jgi:hypothetical protein
MYFKYNNKTGYYEKTTKIRGKEYEMNISPELWNDSTSKSVSRWIRMININKDTPIIFRWGYIKEIEASPITLGKDDCKITLKEEGYSNKKEENDKFKTNIIITNTNNTRGNVSPTKSVGIGLKEECSTEIIKQGYEEEGIISGSCAGCGRVYISRSGLWKHERICDSYKKWLKGSKDIEGEKNIVKSSPIKDEMGIIENKGDKKGEGRIFESQHINNIQNTQNIMNQTININIRDFGDENPAWLTANMLYNVIGNVNKAIPMLMQKKHFNEEFPENMNLRVNKKGDLDLRLLVREKGRWRVRNSKQTFYKVVIDIYEILSDALSETGEEEEEEGEVLHPEISKAKQSSKFIEKVNRIKPIWEEFRKKIYEENDVEVLKELWEDLKTFLLDRKLCVEQEGDN